MSTFEKITSAAIALVLIVVVVFSYHEFTEREHGPNFEMSVGRDFKIGTFQTVVSTSASLETEDSCASLQSVTIAVLHDIKTRLEALKSPAFPPAGAGIFEVNEPTLTLLCRTTAEIVLVDTGGNRLILKKVPFVRVIPEQGVSTDIGTRVRINATLVPAGALVPAEPSTYGEILIPDRFLDEVSSPL